MQHPIFSATLAEHRQNDLRREASQVRLARGSRPGRRYTARWWRLAARPAQA
jgi:hypothetical protein